MKKDVKHNTVYNVRWHGTDYLVLYNENRLGNDHYIRLGAKKFDSNAAFSTNSYFLSYLTNPQPGITVKETTPVEDKWLRMCIIENRYVDCPKEETINNYQIY